MHHKFVSHLIRLDVASQLNQMQRSDKWDLNQNGLEDAETTVNHDESNWAVAHKFLTEFQNERKIFHHSLTTLEHMGHMIWLKCISSNMSSSSVCMQNSFFPLKYPLNILIKFRKVQTMLDVTNLNAKMKMKMKIQSQTKLRKYY